LRPDEELELVHRLDRDTSGCLLVAKKRSMLRALHDELRTGGLKKTYLLIVHGRWPAQLTSVDTALTKYIAGNGERRVKADPGGKASRTDFRVEAQAGSATLLQATLHTGRTHQIRVHAKTSGHSIVGDEKYATAEELAADQALGVRRLCLHAGHVGIPTEAGLQTFDAPLPEDFQAAWRKLSRLAVTENG
jgi:23S rRNA pseudouridine955/2504/2580 synthase